MNTIFQSLTDGDGDGAFTSSLRGMGTFLAVFCIVSTKHFHLSLSSEMSSLPCKLELSGGFSSQCCHHEKGKTRGFK